MFAPQAGGPAKSPAARAPARAEAVERRDTAAGPSAADVPSPAVEISVSFRLAPSAFDPLIEEAARRFHVDAALVRAIIRAESNFDPQAVSSAGALGLMQLMPDVAAERGVENPFDPRANIMAGVQYFSELLEFHGGDLALALASYNAGPAAVAQYQGVPPFPETQQYIARITAFVGLTPDEH